MEHSRTNVLIRVTGRRSIFLPITEATGILPCFPFAVKSGCAYWEILGVERDSRDLIGLIEHSLPGSRVAAVLSSRASVGGPQLTPRQEAVFQKAIQRGYYDFPRRITLTELAKVIGVDKGSLSIMLVRIEACLADYWNSSYSLPRPWVPTLDVPGQVRKRGGRV